MAKRLADLFFHHSTAEERWGMAYAYMGAPETPIDARTMAELLRMSIIDVTMEHGNFEAALKETIELPVHAAMLICEALENSKRPRGRQRASLVESLSYDDLIREAKALRSDLVAAGVEFLRAQADAVAMIAKGFPNLAPSTIERDLRRAERAKPYRR